MSGTSDLKPGAAQRSDGCGASGPSVSEVKVVGFSSVAGTSALGVTNVKTSCLEGCQVIFFVNEGADLAAIEDMAKRIENSCIV